MSNLDLALVMVLVRLAAMLLSSRMSEDCQLLHSVVLSECVGLLQHRTLPGLVTTRLEERPALRILTSRNIVSNAFRKIFWLLLLLLLRRR